MIKVTDRFAHTRDMKVEIRLSDDHKFPVHGDVHRVETSEDGKHVMIETRTGDVRRIQTFTDVKELVIVGA